VWPFKRKSKPTRVSLESQIEALASCNIRINPGVGIEDVLAQFGRDQLEENPYGLLLSALGDQETEFSPKSPLSNDVWYFDTECIYGHGSYVRIATHLRLLADGDFSLEDITDHVEIDSNDVWLQFRLDGKVHRLVLEAQDDWVDYQVFRKLADLFDGRQAEKHFTCLDLAGQDLIIGCSTPSDLDKLRNVTGMKWDWLT
jgi:hypothetical protein